MQMRTGLTVRVILALLLCGAALPPAAAFAFEAVAIREYREFPEGGEPAAPAGVAVLADSTLVIADPDNGRVIMFRPDGGKIILAARPTGLAAAGNRLLVAETDRIRQFSADGRELPVLAAEPAFDFSRLAGLAVDAAGNVYVADRGNDVIYVISPDGLPLTVIGKGAKDEAELSGPVDVAADDFGRVIIADAGNERVAIYTTGGRFLSAVGPIEEPVAVTVDARGLCYVADDDAGRVQRYDLAGKAQGAFGASGRTRGQFRALRDIDIAADGLLRVLDSKNRSLHVLSWPAPAGPEPAAVLPLSARWEVSVNPLLGRPLGEAPDGQLLMATAAGEAIIYDRQMQETCRLPAGSLREPAAAASDRAGRLYVVDRDAGEIKAYDRTGGELFSFGRGSRVIFFRGGSGKLVSPRAIAISAAGVLAVADKDKVELYGPDGTFMSAVGIEGDEPGQIGEPVGVAFAPDGSVFIADADNGWLAKYDAAGEFTGKLVTERQPLALAADGQGRIYLLDRHGPQIEVYSSDLEPLLTIGNGNSGFAGLKGAERLVCVGDRLYVSRDAGMIAFGLDLPLPPPTGVRVTPEVRGVTVAWDAVGGVADTVSIVAGARRTLTARNPAVVTGLADETEYRVQVSAVNRFGRDGYPAVLAVRTLPLTLPAPQPPDVVFLPDLAGVAINWAPLASPAVVGYAVEGEQEGRFVRLATANSTACTLDASGVRRYRVRALADNGREGPPSPEAAHAAAEGFALLLAGENALAAERLARAGEKEPDNPAVWCALGEADEKLERFSEAVQAYGRARRLVPGDTASALGLARLALLRSETETARANLAVAAAWPAAERSADYQHAAGLLALAGGEYDTAVRRLAAAVVLQPTARNRADLARAEEAQRTLGQNRPRLLISAVRLNPIFPGLYKSYANRPVGTMTVRNAGNIPLEQVRCSVFIRGAMDFPSDTVIARLLPGEAIDVALRVELTNSILNITEDDTKQAELRLTYYRSGEPVEVKQTATVWLYARTGLAWDDLRAVASFVTPRAPAVVEFARAVAGYAGEPFAGANRPLRTAQLVRAALMARGLRYQADPASPLAAGAAGREAVDYVQLPEQTLRLRSGDCDDLMVLYAALLENLGVRTMVMDVPGHVLLLVDSELPPEAAGQVAPDGQWLEHLGTAWLPLETTKLDGSFATAVAAGAGHMRNPQRRTCTLAAAWASYPPVTTLAEDLRLTPPDREATIRQFNRDDRELRQRMATAQAGHDLRAAESDTAAANRLGAIYARLGFYAEAEQFMRRDGRSAAALNNLGNLALLQGNNEQAREFYRRAAQLAPGDAGIRRNLERVP